MKKTRFAAAILAAALTITGAGVPSGIIPAQIVAEAASVAAPANIAAKESKKNIVITWDEVKGADAYRVYMYNPETKKYEKYKTVTGTKCTVKNVEKGKTYKFKVASLTKTDGKYKLEKTSKKVSIKVAGNAAPEKKADCDSWQILKVSDKYYTLVGAEAGTIVVYWKSKNGNENSAFNGYKKFLEDSGCVLESVKGITLDGEKFKVYYNVYKSDGKTCMGGFGKLEGGSMMITYGHCMEDYWDGGETCQCEIYRIV